MSNRFTDSEKWKDPWFHKLPHKSKLVFLYLCDACDIAGFWEIDEDRCAYETGIDRKSIPDCLDRMGEKIVFNGRYLWLRNFIKRQKNIPLCISNNAHKGIIKRLGQFRGLSDDIDVLLDGGNPYISTSPAPAQPLTRGTGKGKGKDNSKSNTKNSIKDIEKEFNEQFWPSCPNKIGKGVAREAFIKARKKADLPAIIAGLSVYAAYEDGRRGQEDYRPLHPATWLNQERWEDEHTQKPPSSGKGKRPIDTGGYRRGREEFADMGSGVK